MRSLFVIGLVLLVLLSLPGLVIFGYDLVGEGAKINQWLETTFSISHRIALALPAAIFLFCIPPIIVLLYFLRLKRKPIAVPSTFLWKKSVEDLHVNRLLQWMRQNVLLLMQLLAILLLIYAVLGPRTHGAVMGGRYYIIMIDNSASMSATDIKPNRLEWAKAEAIREIDAATDADTGMVIVFNSNAEIRQSYTSNREELRAAIRGIQPTAFPTRIDEALSLAASRANPDRSTANEAVAPQNPEPGKERTYVQNEGLSAEIHLYSDGKFPPLPEFALANLNVTYHPPPSNEGRFAKNVAIVRFFAERDPEFPTTVKARAGVRSFRGNPSEEVKLKLDARDENNRLIIGLAKSATLALPDEASFAEGEVEFSIPDIAENADVTLELNLDHSGDILDLDDKAWIVLGPIRKARVLIVTPGNRLLRNYFDTAAAKKLADFVYISPAEWKDSADKESVAAREGKFDLAIFDRAGPEQETGMPLANTLFIGQPPPPYTRTPAKPDDPNAVIAVPSPAVRIWQARHPILRNLRGLDEIRIAEAFRLPYLPPRTPRLLEGDRDLVLLAALPRQSYTDLVLTFPLVTENADGPDKVWHSDWPLRPSFVLFLRNVLISLGDVRDSSTEETLTPGQIKPFRLRGAKVATITKPDNRTVKLERGNRPDFIFNETDNLGLYRIEWEDQSRSFAVNLFDPLESDLAPRGELVIGAGEPIKAGESRKQPFDLWKLFAGFALVVVLAEWWLYNKRVQI